MVAWDGEALDVEQRVALAVVARSPIERLVAFKKKRGWRSLKLYSDVPGEFSRDYHAVTPIIVFTRRDGRIHHFWSGEMSSETTDPGQEFRIPIGPASFGRYIENRPDRHEVRRAARILYGG